jgi:hypothetical protein
MLFCQHCRRSRDGSPRRCVCAAAAVSVFAASPVLHELPHGQLLNLRGSLHVQPILPPDLPHTHHDKAPPPQTSRISIVASTSSLASANGAIWWHVPGWPPNS